MTRQRMAALALALFVPACSAGRPSPGAGPGMLPYAASTEAATMAKTGTVKVKIVIPAPTASRSHYVSPSTKSIVIKVYSAKHKLLASKTQNLIAGKKGCERRAAAVVCTFEFGAPAGKDRFDATTYDRRKGKGNGLSLLSNFARTVKAGKTVKLPLALDGIPHSVTMDLIDDSTFKTGDSTSGFQFAGLIAHTMQLAALDADGNIIVGKGAPTLALGTSDVASVSASAVSGTTNDFLLTPHAAASSITLRATAKATYKGAALVTSTAGLAISSVLYVANYGATSSDKGSVTVYAPWTATPIETITTGVNEPGVMTVDSSGNLWIGNDDLAGVSATPSPLPGSIVEFAPGSATPSRTIPVHDPNTAGGESLAVDKSGNVYCACDSASDVLEFTPAGGSTPARTLTSTTSPTGIDGPYSVGVDAAGNLYVANYSSNAVGISVFAPGATTPSRNITSGISGVWLLALDKAGNVYAGNYDGSPGTVTKYAAGSGTVAQTFGATSGISEIYALAVDASENVYVGNGGDCPSCTAAEFTASSLSSPARVFATGNQYIYGIAADSAGNVYVPLSGTSTVLEFPAGSSTTVSRTLTSANGINTPYYVATWP